MDGGVFRPGNAGHPVVLDTTDAVWPLEIDPLTSTPVWTAESNQAGAAFGVAVGTAGDVNGDGYSDVIVGAPLFDNVQTNQGRAFLYLGSPSGLSSTAAWTADGDQGGARFGGAVGTAGDVNNDGYSDVIVGAESHSLSGSTVADIDGDADADMVFHFMTVDARISCTVVAGSLTGRLRDGRGIRGSDSLNIVGCTAGISATRARDGEVPAWLSRP